MSVGTLACLVSALVGFASLGQEILWVRLVAFANGNTPQTFALVLALFLLGIVLGALAGKRLCADSEEDRIRHWGAGVLMLSGLIDVAAPQVLVRLENSLTFMPVMSLFILATATTKATLFPVVHHMGGRLGGHDVGRSIARVYFANIAGATLCPILIGFWWLDHVSSQGLMVALGGVTFLAAGLLAPRAVVRSVAAVGGVIAVVGVVVQPQQTTLLRHLAQPEPGDEIAFMRENRHGVVHTVRHARGGETVFGGNIYDGKINVDLLHNSNKIDRVWVLSALHARPRRVLVIGLSGGSWTRVLAAFPGVERIDVVEIQPAYIELIRDRPQVAPILSDPRVRIHVDDGRRWLRRHDEERFDLIVMNTTFHWRAYATNLLSVEFMRLARARLNPGGMLAFNATGSPDALMTATRAFPHAYRWGDSNFVYAAEHDFRSPADANGGMRLQQVVEALGAQPGPGWPTVSEAVAAALKRGWITVEKESQLAGRPLEVISDQNMLTEYRRGRAFVW